MNQHQQIIDRAFGSVTTKHVTLGEFPNQRVLIIPDEGQTLIEMDLDRADAQFVAWEAQDEVLKDILKAGIDLHLQNAKDIWGSHIKKKSAERQLAKRFCHAVNYGAYPKKLARSLGITLKTAEWIYSRWFQLHPGIRDWHNRTRRQLATEHLIRNPFGYERYYFERPESALNEALAWLPQSSVGIIINTAWKQINKELPIVEVLMQTHDSLTMQAPSQRVRELLPEIQKRSLIVVPYPDPLIIPVGFKVSDKNWGSVEDPCWKEEKGIDEPICIDFELNKWLSEGLASAKRDATGRGLATVV